MNTNQRLMTVRNYLYEQGVIATEQEWQDCRRLISHADASNRLELEELCVRSASLIEAEKRFLQDLNTLARNQHN